MISHWLGWMISLSLVLCLLFIYAIRAVISKHVLIHVRVIHILLFLFLFLSVCIIFNWKADNNNFYFYIYQYSSLFVIIILFLLSSIKQKKDILSLGRVIYWLAFSTIFIEFIAVNYLGISKDIMPAVRFEHGYYENYLGFHRPFGLTGQPSANGGILLLCFLLLYEIDTVEKKYLITFLIGTVLTMSGQSILTNFIIYAYLVLKNGKLNFAKYFLFFGVIGFFFLASSAFADKLSTDYLYYVLVDQLHYEENLGKFTALQFMFGTLGYEVAYGTEVYLIESIRCFGIIFTVTFWFLVWRLCQNTKLGNVFFIAIFLSSLHYPTIFYIEAQIPVALFYLYKVQSRSTGDIIAKY